MPPTKHALLGASGSHRWLECTPSARDEQRYGEDVQSEAAAEGTVAHEVAETHLRQILQKKKIMTPKKLKEHPLYKPVMQDYVGEYTDYVLEHYKAYKPGSALLMLEEHVDYTDWVPEGFGTCDALLIGDGTMQVFDLKYGKGVPVDAVGNPQLRLYALGALNEYSLLYDIQKVTYHIIQPRLDSISSETMTAEELLTWADTYVRPRAKLAWDGEGEYEPGEHCRFCKCKVRCRAYAEHQLEIAKARFSEPDHEERLPNALSDAEIAGVLEGVDELTRWAKSVKDYALDQAVNHGKQFPGWKLVAGRSNRKIADEKAALWKLIGEGYSSDALTELKGMTSLEQVVGKKKLAQVLGDLIIKPEGKPVLAPESDKRPAVGLQTAQTVFKVETDEKEN